MELHLLAVAGEELRQAELGLMAKSLRGGLHLRLLEFDMSDEFGGFVLRIEGRAVAAQGLLVLHADHATGGDDGAAGGVASGAVADQAFELLTSGAFAETFGDHAALEDHQGAAFHGRGIHAGRAQSQAPGQRLGEVEFGDDVGEDRETVALGRRAPAPALAGQVESRGRRLHDAAALRGASRRDHRAVGAREHGPGLAAAERLHLDDLHVPHAGFGGRAHELRGGFPDLLRLLVFGETGEGTADHLTERNVFLLRHGSRGQEEAEKKGSHGVMTSSGEG